MIEVHEEFREGYGYIFSRRAYLQNCALNPNTNIGEFRFDGTDKQAWYNWLDGYPVTVEDCLGYVTYTYGKGTPINYNVSPRWCIPTKQNRR